jgi:outer membrane usher protein
MRKFWRNVLWLITFSLFSESIFIAQAEASRVENLQKAQESFFEVYINGRDLNEVTMFLDMKQTIWVSHEKLLQWGLIVPPFQKGQHYQKRLYYPLSAVRDASYTIDRKKMAIHLVFSPTNFVPNTFDASKFNFSHPTKPGFGAFMNYDVLEREFTGLSSTNGFFAPGIFTPKGSLNSGFLAQRNHGIDVDNQNMVRLNTQWETDYPEKMKSLKAGDSFSTPGLWGNSVGFGGIQWGTNFATQPQFVTFPLPSASGIAVAPSTVDLYINNVLSNNKTVTTGPFTINAIPVVTGSGTVNVVTTDLLGRQQVVNLPYYASEELLKPGLHDYSFEAGFVRKNFGTESNDYGQFAAIGTDNIGITDKLTGQWHTELQRDQQNLGIGEDYLVGKVGILSSSVAVSRDAHSAGQLLLLGFHRQSIMGCECKRRQILFAKRG